MGFTFNLYRYKNIYAFNVFVAVVRMYMTYADAAISITITTLTNVLSFAIGAVVPGFPCVQGQFF